MAVITNIADLIGCKYGRLTILKDLGIITDSVRSRYVTVICDCGVTKNIPLTYLKEGKVSSCGCLKSELSKERGTKHGLYGHGIYRLWYQIKDRCYNPNTNSYALGVVMCDEWKNNFISFYNWCIENGWKKGLQIDKDMLSPYKTGNIYCPEYCCFLTPKENMQYRSNTVLFSYRDEVKTLSQWADYFSLDYELLRGRYKRGWGIERIIETPCNEKFRNTLTLK